MEIGCRQPRSLIGAFERPWRQRRLFTVGRGPHRLGSRIRNGLAQGHGNIVPVRSIPRDRLRRRAISDEVCKINIDNIRCDFPITFSAADALQGAGSTANPSRLFNKIRSSLVCLVRRLVLPRRSRKAQNLQYIQVAVVVHRNGVEIHDYQIADLGKSYMRGPMWSSGTSIAEREGSQIAGLRQQQRPYRADADMTAVIEIRSGSSIAAEQILAALDQPARPLFFGRTSCPPASRLAGDIFDAPSLEAATLKGRSGSSGEIYLPAEAATPSWGDLPLSIPGRRDWTSFRHAGSDLYVVRQLLPAGSE